MNCVHDRETQLNWLDHAYTARMDDSFEDLLTLSGKKNVNIPIHIFLRGKSLLKLERKECKCPDFNVLCSGQRDAIKFA